MAWLDIRQVVAGVLTLSLFIMLANMIKKDHFDSAIGDMRSAGDGYRIALEHSIYENLSTSTGPWNGNHTTVKPCWNKPAQESWNQANGYIIFSLTGSPHRHFSQVASAVLIARQVKATLVVPAIIVNKAGEKREFGDVYDVNKFVKSLDGIVKIAYHQPQQLSAEKLPIQRVSNVVTEEYIAAKLEPLFKREGNLKLLIDFSTPNMTMVEGMKDMNSVSCMVVFETLQLNTRLQELTDSVLEKLKKLSRKSDGRFIAVDLRNEMLETERCQVTTTVGKKSCFSALEVGHFLSKIGFDRNTTIYLTQYGWKNNLNALTEIFPNTFTKESLVARDQLVKFSNYSDVIDFYICSRSDVFVPAYSRLFYGSVTAQRIALGKTQIYDPAQSNSSNAEDYISPYVSKKNHWAYSCFCET